MTARNTRKPAQRSRKAGPPEVASAVPESLSGQMSSDSGERTNLPTFQSRWEQKIARQYGNGVLAIDPTDRVSLVFEALADGVPDEARRIIVESNIDVNIRHERFENKFTMIGLAARRGYLDLVKFLVQRGANIDEDRGEGTALTCAACGGQQDVYDYLKPLSGARQQEYAARRLIDALLPKSKRKQCASLCEAVVSGQLSVVSELLRRGADPNSCILGMPPVAYAAQGQKAMVALLLGAGANPNQKSAWGTTALMVVNNPGICRLLLDAGADVSMVDDDGHTALTRVVNAECCRLLLDAGARLDILDNHGRGVLPCVAWWAKHRQAMGWPLRRRITDAYDRNLAEIMRLVIAAGANVNERTTDGETALTFLNDLNVPITKRLLAREMKKAARPKK